MDVASQIEQLEQKAIQLKNSVSTPIRHHLSCLETHTGAILTDLLSM